MKVYVGGVGLRGDGYPNAARTIALLEQQADIEVVNCGRWLPEDVHLWKLVLMPRWRAVRWLVCMVTANLTSVLKVRARIRVAPGPVYVPYPGIFFLLWLSMFPSSRRPICIVDSYISIWDSMFRDRSATSSHGIGARLLKRLESRALHVAALVVVDTDANREVFIEEFGLDPEKVRSIPLAIDENRFNAASRVLTKTTGAPIRVLFVGTLVPLHGIGAVLRAFSHLADDARFEFRLIGDGQEGGLVAALVKSQASAKLIWVREWCTLDQIAAEICNADICLGIFGGVGKASRVLPLKLYMYLACGSVIVSQASLSTPHGVPFPPIEAVMQPQANLGAAIRQLANDPARREHLRQTAAEYYLHWLSNSCVTKAWREMLDGLGATTERRASKL